MIQTKRIVHSTGLALASREVLTYMGTPSGVASKITAYAKAFSMEPGLRDIYAMRIGSELLSLSEAIESVQKLSALAMKDAGQLPGGLLKALGKEQVDTVEAAYKRQLEENEETERNVGMLFLCAANNHAALTLG
jgi:hypothetical protein